jgi:hypothetical protein
MRKILLTVISLLLVAALVGCGGSSNSTPTTTAPSGGNNAGFSTSSLNGNYVFSDTGVNSSNVNFHVVGYFVADGAGNISSGSQDYFDDSGSQTQNESLTGTYSVNADGRGQLNVTGSSSDTAAYRFVMQSPSAASFFQFSTSADATGRIMLQSAVNGSVLGGTATYVVRLDGEDTGKLPYGAVGALTLNSTSISGTVDQNDYGVLSTLLPALGSDVAPNTNGRGTLTFTIGGGVPHDFVYYWVSPNHIELVSSDAGFWLHGYADLQTAPASSNGALNGGQVIALSGFDAGVLIENARFTLDGSGGINSGVEDYNENGTYTGNFGFTGTYSVSTTGNGRWTAPVGALASNLIGWQVSPQQSVVLTWNSANSLLETGTMQAQATTVASLTNASISGEYAQNMSGFSLYDSGYVEATSNFLADGAGKLTGTMDSQIPGYFNTDVAETGIYSTNSNGRAGGTISGVPMVLYFVDANTMYMISSDNGRIYQGKMVLQQP